MRILLMIMVFAITAFRVQAQIKGVVTDYNDKTALVGASIYWLNAKTGTTTNENGIFEIALPARWPDMLVVSYIGYENDTIRNLQDGQQVVIKMRTNGTLKEAVVVEEKAAMSYSMIEPLNKQLITQKELKKAACCNLSESFETNATVDVSYTDAVSGSKQIKVLGLDGSYTQMLTEQMPGPRGLSTNYGLAHIPGTWVQGIDITKGVGSVVNGYESMSGQINIELEKPEKADRLFLNIYAGDAGRFEANIHTAHRFNKKWSTLLLTHANSFVKRNDFNKDGYLDQPLGYQLNAFNRWKYEAPGKLMASFGINALVDNRLGGEVDFTKRVQNEQKQFYGVNVNTRHIEAFSKLAVGFAGRPYKSLGIIANARTYEHDAYFGLKNYNGSQQTGYANLIYQSIIRTTEHKFKTGASFMFDQYNEHYFDTRFTDSAFKRREVVPGIFAEYNYDLLGKASVLAGVRADYHNLFGVLVNPRLHIKYNVFKRTVLRLSGGRGLRVANVFIENAAAMASNRRVLVTEKLNPEVAWNYGVSLTHNFKIGNGNASFIADYYRTDFENQVVADMDTDPQLLLFYNLKGKSYSNSFQTELIYEPLKKLEFRFAYKYQDVRTTYGNKLMQRPLVAQDRFLFNAGYATRFDKWKYDVTFKWFGSQRLPATQNNPEGMRMISHANPYYTVNAQITRAFKRWELYVGAENLFDYVQKTQIIDPENPFGNYFDASMIWGPVMGRVIYAGVRVTIK
jgi:outer membrane receptor for ferrienterochelin and colicins